jgi:hypothetical protein
MQTGSNKTKAATALRLYRFVGKTLVTGTDCARIHRQAWRVLPHLIQLRLSCGFSIKSHPIDLGCPDFAMTIRHLGRDAAIVSAPPNR